MNHAPASSLSTDNATRRERVQRNKATFNKKRDAFLQDLVRNLDLLIYAQLSTVYYMECAQFHILTHLTLPLTLPQLLLHTLPRARRHPVHVPVPLACLSS